MTPPIACPDWPRARAPARMLLALAAFPGLAVAQARSEPFQVTNQFPFDVATTQSPPALPSPVDKVVLAGALHRARPVVFECLVAPASRGGARRTRVSIVARVDGGGLELEVSGQNLAAPGRTCIERAVRRHARALPQPVPTSGKLDIEHLADAQPVVRLGVNPASDFAGQVRLAMPAWGHCFEAWAGRVPPPLAADVTITRGAGVTLAWRDTPAPARALATCLGQRIARVPHATGANDTLAFPLRLWFFNSAADEGTQALDPSLRMFQLDARRDRLSADVAIATGVRSVAATGYDVLVHQYKQAATSSLVPALFSGCRRLVAASEAWVGAHAAQVAHNRRIVALAGVLAADDPAWQPLVGQAGGVLNRMDAELHAARRRLAADRAACPRPKAKPSP